MDKKTPIDVAAYIVAQFEDFYNIELTTEGCKKIYKLVLQYQEDECMKTLDIAFAQYDDPVEALMKFGGILNNRAKIRQKYIKTEGSNDEVHD